MLRPTILALALLCAWPATQAAPLPGHSAIPLPAASVLHVEQLMADRQLVEAKTTIQALIKKDPGNARMHYYLAQIHAANGNWVDAGAMLKKAKYYDWRLKFASSKQRVADFERLIEARKIDPYPGIRGTPEHDEFKRNEIRSYDAAPVEAQVPMFLMTMKAPEKVLQVETPRQRTFLWSFATALGALSCVMVFMVRRFNVQHRVNTTRLAQAALKEQKIVLADLMRVLRDVEAITKSESLINLYRESTALLDKVKCLMARLEKDNQLQSIEDIEHYVRKTQLYRRHCHDFQDLPAAV